MLCKSWKYTKKRSLESFYQGNKITIQNLNTYKKNTCIFQGMFGKTPILEISEDSQKNIFGKVLFKEFKLFKLSLITIPKTDSIKWFL